MTSVVLRSPLISRLRAVPVEYPFAFGVVLSGFKTSFSDLLVQKVVERRKEVDWKRNLAFATFGFVYLGGVQYSIYVKVFSRMFPQAGSFAAKPIAQKLKDVKGMFAMGAQVFLDQCIHHPFMYFPAFYCTKELVVSENPDFSRALADYRRNMSEDLLALWKVWVPATVINFSFMPMHARIPFVAGVSLLWTCILSTMRGGDVVHGEEMAGGAVTGATYEMMKEGLDEVFNNSPVEDNLDMEHFNISASGKQRPGLVAALARHVAEHGGNVTQSKMVRLGKEFIIQMHVCVPPSKDDSFFNSLGQGNKLKDLHIHTTKLSKRDYASEDTKAVLGMRVHCVGEDGPGMLATIAEKFASRDLSIEDITTAVRLGKLGKRQFVVNASVSSTNTKHVEDVKSLVEDLEALKQDIGLDIMTIHVHTQ